MCRRGPDTVFALTDCRSFGDNGRLKRKESALHAQEGLTAGHDLHVVAEAVPAPRTIVLELTSVEAEDFAIILREQITADTDLLEDMAASRSPMSQRVLDRMTLAVRLLALT
jgi:hypothetical protein